MSKLIVTIELIADDDGRFVHAEIREPRGIGSFRTGDFASVDACLHSAADTVAMLRKRKPIAGSHPEVP